MMPGSTDPRHPEVSFVCHWPASSPTSLTTLTVWQELHPVLPGPGRDLPLVLLHLLVPPQPKRKTNEMTQPEDWTCRHCGNMVLYRIDHKPTCIHYPHPHTERRGLN